MKKPLSLLSCLVIISVLLLFRFANIKQDQPLKITLWDANGYYLYLPSILIYHDFTQLNWLAEIDKKYAVTGGDGYQAQRAENGNYAFKYLGGVAIMELPFFCIGHFCAHYFHYPPDGFSPPYQYALAFGILLYSFLATLVLRRVLLTYFSDFVTAFTLLLVCLASNYIQYAAVDSGQSHAYIFLLYALVLYTTMRWHERPTWVFAALTGYIVGFATMSRPTEAIMLFIPLMWATQDKTTAAQKWAMVARYKGHVMLAIAFGLLGILPQLLYWKAATGHFIYDTGSKWKFLNPYFRVLFGFEKGWFIYTPVTILFVLGMFFIKKFPFKNSVIWFCLLNIWIIIAWDEWRYGGSYSTRALVQSYPAFALPLAALLTWVGNMKWRPVFYLACDYLLFVNFFQIDQYCKTILHYDDMNRQYYARIYLNPHPTPLDMSMFDDDELLQHEDRYNQQVVLKMDTNIHVNTHSGQPFRLVKLKLNGLKAGERWLKFTCAARANDLSHSYVAMTLTSGNIKKERKARLYNAISKPGQWNDYAFFIRVPDHVQDCTLELSLLSKIDFVGLVDFIKVTAYSK